MNAAATDVAARRMNRAAVRVEARRLRVEDPSLTFEQIGERLGISQNAAWKYARDIQRSCATCGEGFTPDVRSRVTTCPGCREAKATKARERAEQRAAERATLTCDDCGTQLLTPAPLCGMCDPAWDASAVLAAIDAEAAPC